MIIFSGKRDTGEIYVHPQEDSAVLLAVENLAHDAEKVCGRRPAIVHEVTANTTVVVGTVQRVDLPEEIDLAPLRENGAWRWEGYAQQACRGKLYLVGCDRRGAVYAVYDLCERMGVSPWYDLADVPIKRRERVEIPDAWRKVDWPCVRYRGIFLNDEEELNAWAKLHTGDGGIGPVVYKKVFELILRLKGNYIWPAMHVGAFNANPENGRLAQRMGVVTGTSHCDMLHRNNQNEWEKWKKEKGWEDTRYDYTIAGENRERLLTYWRESLEQNRNYEACYTIGMRGIHDSGFVTEGLSESLTEAERLQGQRALLEKIMDAQRKLISQVIPGNMPPQAFVPYKEVLPIYDSGLRVPEDVTLVWVDDNHGYVRRYPNAEEQKRPGGNGLYYHSSYWAPLGMSYLFVCSIPLAHMGNELKKCYQQGIRRMWVDNVGALKPLEQDTEYFLRYGWDAGRPDSAVMDAKRFTADWINRNFSGHHGGEAAEIYTAWAQLSNVCKPEHMRSDVFSQTAYGDEAAARLWRLYDLVERGERIRKALPDEERDAFRQLLLMKVEATFFIAASYYFADRSRALAAMGAQRGADENLRKSRVMDDFKRLLLQDYNERMSGGKWYGILTPEEFPPPTLELYPACTPALEVGDSKLLLRLPAWGDGEGLTFAENGERMKWFELFNAGQGSVAYTLEASEGIEISGASGCVKAEERVFISMKKGVREGCVTISSSGQTLCVPVHRGDVIAADGYLHLTAVSGTIEAGFTRIAGIGRGVGDVLEAGADTTLEKPARVTFQIDWPRSVDCEVEIIRFLTLRSTGKLRVRLLVDGQCAAELSSPTRDEWLGQWVDAAMHDGEKLYALLHLAAGRHSLTVEVLDPYMSIDCVNLYAGCCRACQLGPGVLSACAPLPDFDEQMLAALMDTPLSALRPPRMLYAGEKFWKEDMLYGENEYVAPKRAGQRRNWVNQEGHKNVRAMLKHDMPKEASGAIAWEAENALAQSPNAWSTPGADGAVWTHRQAETNDRTGLAMEIPANHADLAQPGPALHYRFYCASPGAYHAWLLLKFDDARGFRCQFLLDGESLEQGHAAFHTFRSAYQWGWHDLTRLSMNAGEHVLTVRALSPGMAIDRFYLTAGDMYPPMDDAWPENA